MPLTILWGAFHNVQRHAHTFISLLSDSHKEDTNSFGRAERCVPLLGNKLHNLLNIRTDLRKCITQRQVINLALLPPMRTPQVMRPTSLYLKVLQTLCLLRTALKVISSHKLLLYYGPETAREGAREFNEQPKGDAHGEVRAIQQEHHYNTQNLVHQVTDCWRSRRYNALQLQQEQFENV